MSSGYHNLSNLASFVVGIIGMIWSGFLLIVCALCINYASYYQDLIVLAREYYFEEFSNGKCKYSNFHKNLKKNTEEVMDWNKSFTHFLHNDDIQIENAKGKYMRF